MTNKNNIISIAKKTILTESKAIAHLATLVDEEFAEAVSKIYHSKGRVVITGIGKSAVIATKIVATLNSTGTPAIFMHAADAIHGDLGTIQKEDTVICISKSGNTPEIKVLVPLLKKGGNTLIAITSNKTSFLGTHADYVLHAYIEKEACPNNLAPTTSTTAQLVIGDALAVCLLELKAFTSTDFARYHPGGALGKKLYLKVKDIVAGNTKPQVTLETPVKQVILEISKSMLGITAVVEKDAVIGVITDGDIRRMLNAHDNIAGLSARDIMATNPKTITIEAMASEAAEIMEHHEISQLIALENGNYAGVVHLHNLMKEGIL